MSSPVPSGLWTRVPNDGRVASRRPRWAAPRGDVAVTQSLVKDLRIGVPDLATMSGKLLSPLSPLAVSKMWVY